MCHTVFRHRSWWHDRQRVGQALLDAFPGGSRDARFSSCGAKAHVQVSDTDPPTYRIAAETCHDRWCRPCQAERARTVSANLLDALTGKQARFLTLTIQTDKLTLKQAVDKLYRSFAKLRLTVFWRSRVDGGAVVCEVKRAQRSGNWHPHLHALITGHYLELQRLRNHWFRITGDSYIVDIQRPRDLADASRYITKYLSKPVPASLVRNPADLREAMLALHGRRLVATFGDWRGLRLTHTESQANWTNLCTFMELTDRALAGNTESIHLLRLLAGQAGHNPDDVPGWLAETAAYLRGPPPTLF
jgi:hypothetical protein